jgi:cytochrome c-type biogenesis protein CcsB
MKKLLRFFISMPFMGILLIVYAIAMAVATFWENDYGAPIARYFVYNSWWFELIHLLLIINMVGSIFIYKLWHKNKISILVFHVAFIIIILGAAITRYYGFEGMMHIRENKEQNYFTSEKKFLILSEIIDNNEHVVFEKDLFTSPYIKNKFHSNVETSGGKLYLLLDSMILNPEKALVGNENGKPMVELVFPGAMQMSKLILDEANSIIEGDMRFSLNNVLDTSSIRLFIENSKLYIQSPEQCIVSNEMQKSQRIIPANEKTEISAKLVFRIGKTMFIIRDYSENAVTTYVQGYLGHGLSSTALHFTLKKDEKSRQIVLMQTDTSSLESFELGGARFSLFYGSKTINLPFSLYLRDFQLERYPGSHSPSSYASEVTLIDKANNVEKEFRIFMNNILNYQGFRFYQSSYDQDEKGTVLSVNRDGVGTFVTYFGYFLLLVGILWSMIQNRSYLAELSRRTAAIQQKRSKIISTLFILLALGTNQALAQSKVAYNEEHSEQFGKLLVQDPNGRVKPLITMSSEVLRKVARAEKWDGYSAKEVFMGMLFDPAYWKNVKLIKVGNSELMRRMGKSGDYVSFNDLVNEHQGIYLLQEESENAFGKPAAQQSKYDKEVIAVNERVNILFEIFNWKYLRIYPDPSDEHKSWLTPFDAAQIKDSADFEFAKTSFSRYFTEVTKAWTDNNWSEAGIVLKEIQDYQKKYASTIIPSEAKLSIEAQYMKLNIFKRLFGYYGIIGFIFLIILFASVLKPGIPVKKISSVFSILLAILFLVHSYGLGIRWYISGHAPFSNGYESMIYIAWAVMLAGFIFRKNSYITLAATAILAAITLMVANLSWMNPEITPLVPVLKSYWLTIHVSVITASYGFLGLSALVGFLSLLFMISANKNNSVNIGLTISELTNVNHMSMIIGLYLLTIGTFLGAVWANESWGRYWGWDPKETWALISMIVYTFVLHTRMIKPLHTKYYFNFFSVIAFASILMTYFGVNFYLSGLHSYAQGDPVPIPNFVYYTVAGVLSIAALAHYKSSEIIQNREE